MEVGLDGGEGLEEEGPGRAVDLPDGLEQRLACRHQVVALGRQELEPLGFLGVLLHGQRVDRADAFESGDDSGQLVLQGLAVEVEQLDLGHQVVEGCPPLGLDPLHHASPDAGYFGQLHFELVEFLGRLLLASGAGVARWRSLSSRRGGRRGQGALGAGMLGSRARSRVATPLLALLAPLAVLGRERGPLLIELGDLVAERLGAPARPGRWSGWPVPDDRWWRGAGRRRGPPGPASGPGSRGPLSCSPSRVARVDRAAFRLVFGSKPGHVGLAGGRSGLAEAMLGPGRAVR